VRHAVDVCSRSDLHNGRATLWLPVLDSDAERTGFGGDESADPAEWAVALLRTRLAHGAGSRRDLPARKRRATGVIPQYGVHQQQIETRGPI
jgi:hypothetical protein